MGVDRALGRYCKRVAVRVEVRDGGDHQKEGWAPGWVVAARALAPVC